MSINKSIGQKRYSNIITNTYTHTATKDTGQQTNKLDNVVLINNSSVSLSNTTQNMTGAHHDENKELT